MESSDKLTPTYFKVEAIGGGFPTYLTQISQIFQGLPFEHITSIHERFLKVFPGAKIISDDAEAIRLKEKPLMEDIYTLKPWNQFMSFLTS